MSPLCDRKCHYDFPRFRCHYIDFVVLVRYFLTMFCFLKKTMTFRFDFLAYVDEITRTKKY
jgi:hypothetical protein